MTEAEQQDDNQQPGWWGSTLGKLKSALARTKSAVVDSVLETESGSVGDDAQPAQEATLVDCLNEVEHMSARGKRLEEAILEVVKLAPQPMQEVIRGLQARKRSKFPPLEKSIR